MAKLEMYERNNKIWSNEKINNLKNNYLHYVEHKDEAEKYFGKKWSVIRAKALKLGLSLTKKIDNKLKSLPTRTNNKWTDEQLKELRKKYFYYLEHKNEAKFYFKMDWKYICAKAIQLKITSMMINKKCPMFLGCHVAERVLSHVFKDVERMPNGNRGFDFICNKGFKIEVKSSCLHKNKYSFKLNCNKIADYFLLIGFDNRIDLNPQHIWLIKGDLINEVKNLVITNNELGISPLYEYELTDKLKETIECCNKLKNKI